MPILFDLFKMVAALVLVAPLSISGSVKGRRAAGDAGWGTVGVGWSPALAGDPYTERGFPESQ